LLDTDIHVQFARINKSRAASANSQATHESNTPNNKVPTTLVPAKDSPDILFPPFEAVVVVDAAEEDIEEATLDVDKAEELAAVEDTDVAIGEDAVPVLAI